MDQQRPENLIIGSLYRIPLDTPNDMLESQSEKSIKLLDQL
ncbi:MAG: hypothetical protein AAGI69_08920 [Cyanobacteria bacterium P01_H01_bin.21]